MKCEKLYHAEIGVINRTFGAAPRIRSSIVKLRASFSNRQEVTSDASIELEKDQPDVGKVTVTPATVVTPVRILLAAATATD